MAEAVTVISEFKPKYSFPRASKQRWNCKQLSRSFSDCSEFDAYSLAALRAIHQELLSELSELKKHESQIRLANMSKGLPKAACATDINRIKNRRSFLVKLSNGVSQLLQHRNRVLRQHGRISFEQCLIDACRETLCLEQFDLIMALAKQRHADSYELIADKHDYQ